MSRADNLERLMESLINEERAAAGANPVELELRLNASAENHSEWMLANDTFSHTGVGGSSAGDRMEDAGFPFVGSWSWGENIAWQSERGAPGLMDDVADIHDGLMNSPGHRANILNPDYEVIGIGIERGDYLGFDGVMVTQNFASTDGDLQIDNAVSNPGPVAAPDPQPAPDVVAEVDPGEVSTAEPADVQDPDPAQDPAPVDTGDPMDEPQPEQVATDDQAPAENPVPEPVAAEDPIAPEAPEPVAVDEPETDDMPDDLCAGLEQLAQDLADVFKAYLAAIDLDMPDMAIGGMTGDLFCLDDDPEDDTPRAPEAEAPDTETPEGDMGVEATLMNQCDELYLA